MSASASRPSKATGVMPAWASAGAARTRLPRHSTSPSPMTAAATWASSTRSPLAPTEPISGTIGWTPALSIATSVSTTTGRTAERPCAREKARAAIVARTTEAACGAPSPVAWLRTRFFWKRAAASGATGRSTSGPQPVLSP